jgi:hypothetical protein
VGNGLNITLDASSPALAKTYPAGAGEGSIPARIGRGALGLEAIRPESPGNRNATISAGESSEVWTGPALKPASRPEMPPTPKTAKHANIRLLAR